MYWPLGAPKVYASKLRGPELRDGSATLLGFQVSRSGQLLVTISPTSLDVWQTSPAILLTSVERSEVSLTSHGRNIAVHLRPDSSTVAVQTSLGFIITYSLSHEDQSRAYQLQRVDERNRRQSLAGRLDEGSNGQMGIQLRFRMIIKIDAGIAKALALEDEIVVMTERRAAVQCVRWNPDSSGVQISTELLSRLSWMAARSSVVDMIFDRAMSLFVWITSDGTAYAVQRSNGTKSNDSPNRLFRGYGFHHSKDRSPASKAAINARFSLLAVACENGEVHVYTARDYDGNIPPSHKLSPPLSLASTGRISSLAYSPDGYCLFVGYEHGWLLWSVYGKLGGSSFSSNSEISVENDDKWLQGVQAAGWLGGGSELLLTCEGDHRLWVLEIARSAVTNCHCRANINRMLLITSTTVMVYQKHDIPNLTSESSDTSPWHSAQVPRAYLTRQKALRCAVISSDGRYVAVAGRRGLAHYSLYSGRWKMFEDFAAENAFVVRGGMCWFQHVLIAAVEEGDRHELRLYSRELGLSESSPIHVEPLSSYVIALAPSGGDSLLVYTAENILYHYVISFQDVNLVQMGHIALHGIVRAPARVRAVTWSVPDQQWYGDPSQDVIYASVLFLVDAKLVLLQPNQDENGTSKYDMRIIASNVEYYSFVRDQHPARPVSSPSTLRSTFGTNGELTGTILQDSLWYFDGINVLCWPDVQDLFKTVSVENGDDLPRPIPITTDFYPTSVEISQGVIIGLDPELIERRDAAFAFYRLSVRMQLFLPAILEYYLAGHDSSSALSLAHHYQQLPYFPHALELLLHVVLDNEVDGSPDLETALLPRVISFLSSFPEFLDIVVQCTRKTEVRSWATLFACLPSPHELFRESLQKGQLKTAAGYLLVLHTVEETEFGSEQCVDLLRMAKDAGDYELCRELARFLMALDESGSKLREAITRLGPRRNGALMPTSPITHFGTSPLLGHAISVPNLVSASDQARTNSIGRPETRGSIKSAEITMQIVDDHE